MEKYLHLIKYIPLFRGINEKDLVVMLRCLNGYVKNYKKGEYIHTENDKIQNVGIILNGAVDMVKEDLWGNKTILVRVTQHQLFGETFTCGIDSSSAVHFYAVKDSEVLFLPFGRVMHSCSRACTFHHRLIENMVSAIASKNRELMEKIEIISKKSLREKILCYLSLQAQRQNSRYIEIPFGRVAWAEYLCADRSALTRELVKLKEEGLIDFHRNIFQLIK